MELDKDGTLIRSPSHRLVQCSRLSSRSLPADHPTGPYPEPPRRSPAPSGTYSVPHVEPTGTSRDPPAGHPTHPVRAPGKPRNPAYMVKAAHGAVATENTICSEMGVDILKANCAPAVDAGQSALYPSAVILLLSTPTHRGGFMTIRPPSGGKAISIDFREIAPAASNMSMFGKDPLASLFGGLAVGVPGELRGLELAHSLYGRLPWKDVVEPVAKLAAGWKVQKELARRIPMFGRADKITKEWKDIFAPRGAWLTEGEAIARQNYSRTLQTIAERGVDAFYTGEIAESIVAKIRATGGIMTLEDFAAYRPNMYDSLVGSYRGNTVYTTKAPTSGPVLLHILNMCEKFDFPSEGLTDLNIHRLVEALKFGFAARTEIGDLAFFPNHTARIAELSTKEFSAQKWAMIDEEETHTADYYGPIFDIPADHGTTHMSVVDEDGMAVALTTTVNLIFGSQVMDPVTGVILNDEASTLMTSPAPVLSVCEQLDDFSRPGIPNYFGFPPSPYNYPAAGKRPVSSTAPTILERPDGSFLMALGGSGGSRIFGAVAQVILGMDWGWDIGQSVEHPRVHDQLFPAELSIESTFPDGLVSSLDARGHNISIFDINEGRCEIQAVKMEEDGFLYAASDSRKNGIPAGY
ncbi:gamma-glutamyltranspeptidase [Calocera cornea HHB12733]|uniref:Glutathione hydrolase n=1 Tax=Calocera cornea HHB12733 TaxID=1353952 RepID=A0A165HEM6_9BASI|nr:gamma-glutamyltranspeptidase [Calocera cornea HHB12733]